MIPIEFDGVNCVYAKDQPEYLPLPVHRTDDGTVVSCWRLTWPERLQVLFSGCMWYSVLTFNESLQPQRPSVQNPLKGVPPFRVPRWGVSLLEKEG